MYILLRRNLVCVLFNLQRGSEYFNQTLITVPLQTLRLSFEIFGHDHVAVATFLDLALFMSHLFIFHFQPHFHCQLSYVTSFKQTGLLFVHFAKYFLLFLDDKVDEENE